MTTEPRIHLDFFSLFLCAMLLLAHSAARAENNCPWMNEATASGLIGEDASGMAVAVPGKPALCTFAEHANKPMRTFQISVETAPDGHNQYLAVLWRACGSAFTPLSAIGNEAATCTRERHGNIIEALAVGRVRDQIFTVTLGTSIKDDMVLTPAMLKMKIDIAAEQVSGNLY